MKPSPQKKGHKGIANNLLMFANILPVLFETRPATKVEMYSCI